MPDGVDLNAPAVTRFPETPADLNALAEGWLLTMKNEKAKAELAERQREFQRRDKPEPKP